MNLGESKMVAQNSRDRLLEICQEQAARFGHSIEMMKKGAMGTSGMREGRIVDTTQETIDEYLILKADLEATIARIENDDALDDHR